MTNSNPLVAHIHRGMIRAMVQRHIFCPVTGVVLDVDTCTVILDSDGDPSAVFAPEIGDRIREIPNALQAGYTLMER